MMKAPTDPGRVGAFGGKNVAKDLNPPGSNTITRQNTESGVAKELSEDRNTLFGREK